MCNESSLLDSNLDLPVIGSLVYCESGAFDHAANKVMNSQIIILMVVVVSMAFIQGAWSAPQNPLNDIIHAIQNAIANGKNTASY
ncbi:unnamed protein product [Timema podura]|uniref:Uncharacterized protein n=1 Tax=Timema podura TaxID=61482 RepID=A0ABN7P193_TIMPD|nr:unnamed protein product [Timema podura]